MGLQECKNASGGQGFQALCLALALAESVQSLNKNDKTSLSMKVWDQDPESVAVVFETLQSL
jgi:exonuclease SbcC